MKKRLILYGFLILFLALTLTLVNDTLARFSSAYAQIDLLADIRHEIVASYVEEPDQTDMIEAAVRGMVDSLDDPYTVFLSPEEIDIFEKHVHGSFSGIGAVVHIDKKQNRLGIISPLEDSPAWESGVLAGDIVLAIDGEDTKGLNINECVNRLTGPVGTQVTIKVRHPSDADEMITITRAQINIQTVKGFRRDADQRWDYMFDPAHRVAYMRITHFTDHTANAVREALDQIVAAEARGLIIDVRFNAGGLLPSVVTIADMFLAEGQRIVSVKGRAVAEKIYQATNEGTIPDIPIVILANESSASAAEILTGALADNGRAQFIGMRTFGKGSVQQYKSLGDNRDQIHGALKITNAYYYLPNGRNIHKRDDDEPWGVDPDEGFVVIMSAEQVGTMIKARRESEVLKPREQAVDTPAITEAFLAETLADLQLAAAWKALVGKLDTGDWPTVGASGREHLIRQAQREKLKRHRDRLQELLEGVEQDLVDLDLPDSEVEAEDTTEASDRNGIEPNGGMAPGKPDHDAIPVEQAVPTGDDTQP